MTKTLITAFLFSVVLFCQCTSTQSNTSLAEEKTSPFSKIDFVQDDIYVTHNNQKYQWLSLDTLEITDVVTQFKENFDNSWQKRFSEDIVEYLNKLDIYPEQETSCTLKNEEGYIQSFAITFDKDKRVLAKQHFEAEYDKEIDITHVLSKDEALQDLEMLHSFIQNKYSYFFLNDVDVNDEIEKIKQEIPDDISVHDFALMISKFLNKFGDGHSRLHNINFKENGALPFSTHSHFGRVICIQEGKLLNNEFPFLHSINGVSVFELLDISEAYFTQDASSQFIEMVRANRLNRIVEILKLANSDSKSLNIVLESENGETYSLEMDIKEYVSKKNMSAAQMAKMFMELKNNNPFETKHFEDIGYLKIKSMIGLDENDAHQIPYSELQNSKAIIIDVRNNGGGRRDILIELAPHFMSEDQEFIVGNLAKLRTNEIDKNHNLSDRYIYQLSDEHFAANDKINLESWMKDFSNKIDLNDSLYSPYYYLYIKQHADPKFADIPTVILMNEGCYSATDIFLSSFKEINGVTLIGSPSGGGSGRSKRYKLNNSLIELRLSTMASFQPNGNLYDRIGVLPDIEIRDTNKLDYENKIDTQLEFAIDYLKNKMKE